MRISDWSSDVCSSDLAPALGLVGQARGVPSLISHNAYYVNSTGAGSDFDLSIGALPVNYTGRPANAVAINGGVPGPLLRWRQGDTVTLRVANRLGVDTSIHWHGILLPSNMDGVPGLSFRGIRPGETFAYRFTLKRSEEHTSELQSLMRTSSA